MQPEGKGMIVVVAEVDLDPAVQAIADFVDRLEQAAPNFPELG